jgi:hypothetical protein
MNKYASILILFLSLLVFTTNIFNVYAQQQQYCPTTITVIDEDTRAPIAGATVTWSGGQLITDENGRVTFNTIVVSNNRVTASAQEYETDSIWVYCRSCDQSISEVIYLRRIVQPPQPQNCNLDIYIKDQSGNSIDGNIYVDGSYQGYDDHMSVNVQIGTHTVEVRKDGYNSDSSSVTCTCTETKRVDLTLRKIEEGIKLRLSEFDVNPDNVCYRDENIELSVRVNLEQGHDNTFVTTKFYVEDNDGNWHYIDKDDEYLDRGQTKTFSIDFNYYTDFLDEGVHDVRARVEAERIIENIYSELDVRCRYDRETIEVGSISLDNEFPNFGDVIVVSTSITLNYHDYYHEKVYVKGYLDNTLIRSEDMIFYGTDTQTFQFTVDTGKYSTGPHTVRVKAEYRDKTDSSLRTFSTSPVGYYARGKEHCLSVDKIWLDNDLKPGESNKVNVRVMNCGTRYENNVNMKLEAFSKTYYTGEFDVSPGSSKDVFVSITVPEDASEKQTFKITVWNGYTSDTWTKDFVVSTGAPFIEIKPEFVIEDCQRNRVSFDIINNGKVSDTFTISLTGYGAGWITGVPGTITLNPGERKTVNAYMSIPCDTEAGFYEFTITAKGSPEYSITSTIHVVKSLGWPTIFPTGLFVGWVFWLPWIIIILIILFLLVLFFLAFGSSMNSRRRPMFDCNDHGC